MKKRFLSSILLLALVLTMSAPAFAANNTAFDNTIDPEISSKYNCYTIDLNTEPASFTVDTPNSSIDRAISFVKSLDLEEKGFGYVEEACLRELEGYKEANITLEQYTVLTPKSDLMVFGTLNGATYYYTDTSISVGGKKWYQKLTDTKISDSAWLNQLGSLLFTLANHTALIPISAGLSMAGITEPAHISKDDEFRMAVSFTDVYQRAIGRYDNLGNFRTLYYDQRGKATYDIDFCPGNIKDYGNEVDLEFYEQHLPVSVRSYDYDLGREHIMEVCQTLFNRPNSGYVKYSLMDIACNLIYQR